MELWSDAQTVFGPARGCVRRAASCSLRKLRAAVWTSSGGGEPVTVGHPSLSTQQSRHSSQTPAVPSLWGRKHRALGFPFLVSQGSGQECPGGLGVGRGHGSLRMLNRLRDPPNGPRALLKESDRGGGRAQEGSLEGQGALPAARWVRWVEWGAARGHLVSEAGACQLDGGTPSWGHLPELQSATRGKMLFPRLSHGDCSNSWFFISCSGVGVGWGAESPRRARLR